MVAGRSQEERREAFNLQLPGEGRIFAVFAVVALSAF